MRLSQPKIDLANPDKSVGRKLDKSKYTRAMLVNNALISEPLKTCGKSPY